MGLHTVQDSLSGCISEKKVGSRLALLSIVRSIRMFVIGKRLAQSSDARQHYKLDGAHANAEFPVAVTVAVKTVAIHLEKATQCSFTPTDTLSEFGDDTCAAMRVWTSPVSRSGLPEGVGVV